MPNPYVSFPTQDVFAGNSLQISTKTSMKPGSRWIGMSKGSANVAVVNDIHFWKGNESKNPFLASIVLKIGIMTN